MKYRLFVTFFALLLVVVGGCYLRFQHADWLPSFFIKYSGGANQISSLVSFGNQLIPLLCEGDSDVLSPFLSPEGLLVYSGNMIQQVQRTAIPSDLFGLLSVSRLMSSDFTLSFVGSFRDFLEQYSSTENDYFDTDPLYDLSATLVLRYSSGSGESFESDETKENSVYLCIEDRSSEYFLRAIIF